MYQQLHEWAVAALPVISIVLFVYMLIDWYRFARTRRLFWLIIILIFGVVGYVFFLFSKDRLEDPPQPI